MLRDIELVGVSRSLGIAHEDAIDPDVVSTVDAIKAQSELIRRFPRTGDMERSLVGSSGILCGNVGGTDGNGVLDVGVPGFAIALELPVARDRLLGPGGIRINSTGDSIGGRCFEGRRGVVKVPSAVEEKMLLGDEVGASRETVAPEDGLVAVVWLVSVLLGRDAGGSHLEILAHGCHRGADRRAPREEGQLIVRGSWTLYMGNGRCDDECCRVDIVRNDLPCVCLYVPEGCEFAAGSHDHAYEKTCARDVLTALQSKDGAPFIASKWWGSGATPHRLDRGLPARGAQASPQSLRYLRLGERDASN